MSTSENSSGGVIIPTLRYSDAAVAIDWLCNAFAFEKHLVVPDDDGGVAHAQLTFGNGMIMLSSVRSDEYGHRTVENLPAEGFRRHSRRDFHETGGDARIGVALLHHRA